MSAKKRFKVTVDGRAFEVEVEELQDSGSGPIGGKPVDKPPVAPSGNNAPAIGGAAKAKSSSPESSGPGAVTAAMAGKVLKLAVQEGAKVKAGDLLVVLEAMKMETNVNAGSDGEVVEVFVKEGDSVDTGAPLLRVE